MACTCMDQFDAKLAGHNTRLTRSFTFLPEAQERPVIAVEKINPRVRRQVMAAPTYCPFCGVAYAQSAKTDEPKSPPRPPASPPVPPRTPEDGQRPATPEDGRPVTTR